MHLASLSPLSTLRFLLPLSPKLFPLPSLFRISAMGPNSQGGRRGGGFSSGRGGGRRGGGRGGGGGGGRGGGGGGGRGEQRWWDPVWRAERLRQQQAEVMNMKSFQILGIWELNNLSSVNESFLSERYLDLLHRVWSCWSNFFVPRHKA